MSIRGSQLNNLLFPGIITHVPGADNKIFLTFDDGPTPGITNQVLAFLSLYKARATFFCKGENVVMYPELSKKISEAGHTIGNHGYSHLHGWYTQTRKYVVDCKRAAAIIPGSLFRPPYGKITPWQFRELKKDFVIYLWTALSWDFHPMVSPRFCFKLAARSLKPGAILVFHDTVKASDKLIYALPRLLELGLNKGFSFEALSVSKESDRKDSAERESF